MAPKKKKNKLLIKLVSGAGTGFFYLFKKTPAIAQKKLALRKFDPIVNQYVIFNEAKLKFSTFIKPQAIQTAVPVAVNPVNYALRTPLFTFFKAVFGAGLVGGVGYLGQTPLNHFNNWYANIYAPYTKEQLGLIKQNPHTKIITVEVEMIPHQIVQDNSAPVLVSDFAPYMTEEYKALHAEKRQKWAEEEANTQKQYQEYVATIDPLAAGILDSTSTYNKKVAHVV